MMRLLIPTILITLCLAFPSVPFFSAQKSDASDLLVVIVNDKRGFIDRTGKMVIEPKWGGANNFSEGLAVVATNEGGYKEGYIDATGKLVIPARFDKVTDFDDGLALVGVGEFGLHDSGDHHWGFIDKSGKWAIKPIFRNLYGFSDGLAAAKNDEGKWGFIDKAGKTVIPFQFEVGGFFSEGMASMFAKKDNRYGYIDRVRQMGY